MARFSAYPTLPILGVFPGRISDSLLGNPAISNAFGGTRRQVIATGPDCLVETKRKVRSDLQFV
jgi:hypothetical protein